MLLCEKTGQAVILFPLSFHINRGLPEWSDKKKMAGLVESRRKQYPGLKESSIVNLALSERLTHYPERFFFPGLQSTMDLIRLIKQIQQGEHSLFQKNTRLNLFAIQSAA